MLAIGTQLCTKNSQRFANAVVLNSGLDMTTVLSDFGNELEFKTEMIFEHYDVSDNYIEALAIEHPLDSIPDRIKKQIELLQSALEKYQES